MLGDLLLFFVQFSALFVAGFFLLVLLMPKVPLQEFIHAGRSWFRRGFDRVLRINDCPITVNEAANTISFQYKVPENLCQPLLRSSSSSSSGDKYLGCAAIMALFDQASTLSLIAKDSLHRPGVSVNLTSHLTGPFVRPGDEVTIVCKATKTGRTLGFSACEMFDHQGSLVAFGRHTKFMKMGVFWDVIMSSWCFPLTFRVLKLPFVAAWLDNRIPKHNLSEEARTELAAILNLKALSKDEQAKYKRVEENKNENDDSENSNEAIFTLPKQQQLVNGFGHYHGGALAMSCEFANRQEDMVCVSMACHYAKVGKRSVDIVPLHSIDHKDNHFRAVNMMERNSILVQSELKYLPIEQMEE